MKSGKVDYPLLTELQQKFGQAQIFVDSGLTYLSEAILRLVTAIFVVPDFYFEAYSEHLKLKIETSAGFKDLILNHITYDKLDPKKKTKFTTLNNTTFIFDPIKQVIDDVRANVYGIKLSKKTKLSNGAQAYEIEGILVQEKLPKEIMTSASGIDKLADEQMLSLFKQMTPEDIVNTCSNIEQRCRKFRYWNNLIDHFFDILPNKSTYNSFKHLTSGIRRTVMVDLHWAENEDEIENDINDPNLLKLRPEIINQRPEYQEGERPVIIELDLPIESEVNIWLLTQWFEPPGDMIRPTDYKIFNKNQYDDLLKQLYRDMLHNSDDYMLLSDESNGELLANRGVLISGYEDENFDMEALDNKFYTALDRFVRKYMPADLQPPKSIEELKSLLPRQQGEIGNYNTMDTYGYYTIANITLTRSNH